MTIVRRFTALVRYLAVFVIVTFVIPATAAGVVLGTNLFVPLPAILPTPEQQEVIRPSEVYDTFGNKIHTYRQFDSNIPVSQSDIPDTVKSAVIAAEDRNFYEHDGVDIRGTVRALWADLQNREFTQGGSTITQQLVKNAYGVGSDRTISRKIREAVLASQLDRGMEKDRILYEYLEIVYFGEGAYGVGAAADTYFRKRVGELDISEAALLAGVIPAPSRFNPRVDRATAEARRRLVLDAMLEEGLISLPEWEDHSRRVVVLDTTEDPTYRNEDGSLRTDLPMTLVRSPEAPISPFPWFIESYLTRFLTDALGSEELLYRGGLRIETTLDPGLQFLAETAVAETLDGVPPKTDSRRVRDQACIDEIRSRIDLTADQRDDAIGECPFVDVDVVNTLQMSLTAIEPPTGYVRAMVGGRDFFSDQTNIAIKGAGSLGRPTGSAFKPVVLAEAFEQGIKPETVYSGGPLTIGRYSPQNYGGARYGNMTLRRATWSSVNTVFVRLMRDVGPYEVVDLANELGLDIPEIEPAIDGSGLAIALGSRNASTLGMASTYGTFANGGMRMPPTPVLRVFDAEGILLLDFTQPDGERILKQETADNVTDVLRGVITSGTARGASIGRPAAGKTGTGQDNRDAWFVGYTPTLSTAVFMGYDQNARMNNVKGRAVTGGSFPAATWKSFMQAALEDVPVTDFNEPAPIRDVASDEIRQERRGYSPGAPQRARPAPQGGPYIRDLDDPDAPVPTTTTTTTEPAPEETSTTTTTTTEPDGPGGGILIPSGGDP